jgi:hypothetical protein
MKKLNFILMSLMLTVLTSNFASAKDVAITASDYTVTINATGYLTTSVIPENWNITRIKLVDDASTAYPGLHGYLIIQFYEQSESVMLQFTTNDKDISWGACPNAKNFKVNFGIIWQTIQLIGTRPAILLTSISVSPTTKTLTSKGEQVTLAATTLPTNADDKTYTWGSSDTSVATVDASGKVTSVASGSATISATANDGSAVSDSCTITVNIPTTAVNDVDINTLKVYPNPCVNELKVSEYKGEVSIFDLSGKMVLTTIANENIDVSDLKEGLYVVKAGNLITKVLKK